MPLSPEEQAELESLQSSAPSVSNSQAPSGLSPDEAAELAALTKPQDPAAPESKDLTEKLLGKNGADTLRGYVNGASLGTQNVIGGATQAGLDAAMTGLNKMGLSKPSPSQVDTKLKTQGTTGDLNSSRMDLYQQGKDLTKKAFDTSKERSPLTYGAASLAGAAVPMATMGMNPAALAAQGAISNVASGDANIIGPDSNKLGAAINAGVGAGVGFATGKAGEALSGLSGEAVKRFGANSAARAMKLAPGLTPGAEGAGQALLDNGLPITGSRQVLNDAVQSTRKGLGQELNQALDAGQEALNSSTEAGADVDPIANKLAQTTYQFAGKLNKAEQQSVVNAANNEAERIIGADGDLNALNDLKKEFAQKAKSTYGNNSPQQNSTMANYYNKLADMVRNHIVELSNSSAAGTGDAIADANEAYAPFINAGQKSLKAATTEAVNSGGVPDVNLTSPVKSAMKLVAGVKDPTLLAQTASANVANNGIVQTGADITGNAARLFSPAANAAAISPGARGAAASIYRQDNQKYQDYAAKLSANPNTKHLGTALNDAMNSNNELAKTQALFVIQQNPQARKVIDGSDGQ